MATTLHFRTTTANGIGVYRDMTTGGETAGAGVSAIVNTAASGTNIQWTITAGGTLLEFISGRSPVGGWTFAGTVIFNCRASENNMSANAGMRFRYYKRTAAGVETEIASSPVDRGTEFITSNEAFAISETPTSTAFAENDRLVVKPFITNVGTMGAGFTCEFRYGGQFNTFGADSQCVLTEDVTFKAEEVAPASLVLDPYAPFRHMIVR